MRIGTNKRPFYRVVAVDERAKRTGAYVELLGTYNPLTEPKDIKLKQDRIDYWIKQGAQMSDGFLRIIGKAPQRPPRKPKKQSKQVTGDSGQVKKEEPPTEEIKQEEKVETEETKPETGKEKEETVPTEEPKTETEKKKEEPQVEEEPAKENEGVA